MTSGAQSDLSADAAASENLKAKGKRSVPFLAGSLAAGNLISMGLRLVGGILIGRVVAPATLGLFNGIGLVLSYLPLLQLGVLNGLNRELPYFVGKGDSRRVERLAAAAQAWAIACGGAAFLALAGIAVWQLAIGEAWKAAGWATNAVLAVFLFYATFYLQMTFRTAHHFARLAIVNVIDAALALLLLVLVAYASFYGLCIRSLVVGLASAALLYYWRPVRVGPRWNLRELKHLLVIGAPIFGVGQLYSYWGVANSTLVLKFTGTSGMGLYAMVLLATTALDVVPSAFSQVLYPRMAEEYGRTGDTRRLLRMVYKPTLFLVVGFVAVVAIAWWLVGPVMRFVVPAYAEAISAVQWALPLALVSALSPVTNVFNVVRRQDLYVGAILVGIGFYAGALMWLIRDGVSLQCFPQAMLLGRGMYLVVSYLLIWYLSGKSSGAPSGPRESVDDVERRT